MEPRYTPDELRERKREIEALRKQAVESWEADDGTAAKHTALVIMTFGDYLKLVEHARQ